MQSRGFLGSVFYLCSMKRILTLIAIAFTLTAQGQYRAALMGDSIFDSWDSVKHGGHPEFFSQNRILNCGKSGQVTSQMVERFNRDIIQNAPKTVFICGGTNDIAQNKGYIPNRQIAKNIATMAETAEKAGIEVVLCSLLPAAKYPWKPEIKPVKPIAGLNRRIKKLAKRKNYGFIDFYTPLAAKDGSLPKTLSKDGVHPNSDCYNIMENILKKWLE